MFYTLTEARKININWPDIYFDPDYGQAVQESDTGIWECYYIPNKFLYVYLVRDKKICALYGYAGIYIYPTISNDEYLELREQFLYQAREKGYTNEFLRLNPYLGTINIIDMELVKAKKTYGMKMIDYDTYWKKANGDHRNMTRKGIKLNYKFDFSLIKTGDLAPNGSFRTIYKAAMDALKADSYYYFNDAYFDYLENIPNVYIATVWNKDGDRLLGASLFFVYQPFIHYHLSATNKETNCIHDFMLNKVIEYTFNNLTNINFMHLGGGVEDNDYLAKFKRKICPFELDYYIYNKIL